MACALHIHFTPRLLALTICFLDEGGDTAVPEERGPGWGQSRARAGPGEGGEEEVLARRSRPAVGIGAWGRCTHVLEMIREIPEDQRETRKRGGGGCGEGVGVVKREGERGEKGEGGKGTRGEELRERM